MNYILKDREVLYRMDSEKAVPAISIDIDINAGVIQVNKAFNRSITCGIDELGICHLDTDKEGTVKQYLNL